MPAWASGAWASGAWAVGAWDEDVFAGIEVELPVASFTMASGGSLGVALRLHSAEIEFAVQNTGIGIELPVASFEILAGGSLDGVDYEFTPAIPPVIVEEFPLLGELRLGPLFSPVDYAVAHNEEQDKINEIIRALNLVLDRIRDL